MREGDFDDVLVDLENSVRQPDFAAIERRAERVRNRRRAAGVGTVAALTLVAGSIGYAAAGEHGPGGDPPGGADVAASTPTIPADEVLDPPEVTNVRAGDADHLYATIARCIHCPVELWASDDGGESWQRRATPPAEAVGNDGRSGGAGMTAIGGRVLRWSAWLPVKLRPAPTPSGSASSSADEDFRGQFVIPDEAGRPTDWISVDGGVTWAQEAVGADPVAEVPPGTVPFGCAAGAKDGSCRPLTVDPRTGAMAPLAGKPTGIMVSDSWDEQGRPRADAHLWLAGVDPITFKPAVAVSTDRGRTFSTHVFADAVAPPERLDRLPSTGMPPEIAVGPDGTAYALLRRDGDLRDAYRTTDGGRTWARLPGQTPISPDAGYVTADGDHVLVTHPGENTRMMVSHDGGPYRPQTLPGYPTDQVFPRYARQVAPGRWLDRTEHEVLLSDDGRTWRTVRIP